MDDTMDRHQRGFSLIECMVSTFVFFIVIVGLGSTTVMVIKGNTISQAVSVATTLATDQLESLQNMGYNDITSGGPETLQTIYTRQWTITNNVPILNTKTIAVTVSWQMLGVMRSVTLTTILTR